MPTRQVTEEPLAPELEAVATAAADELHVLMDENSETAQVPHSAVPDAASAAIAAGMPLAAIADAERLGQARARRELGSDVLRRVERAARRKRETDDQSTQSSEPAGSASPIARSPPPHRLRTAPYARSSPEATARRATIRATQSRRSATHGNPLIRNAADRP